MNKYRFILKKAKNTFWPKTHNTKISEGVSVGKKSTINYAIVRGKVSIGKYTSINGPATVIASKHTKIEIGNYCSVAQNVTIMEYSHNVGSLSTAFLDKKLYGKSSMEDSRSKGSIVIGSDVWIGAGSVILSGVKIGNGAVIAANSVVNTDVPDFAIVGGTPVKIIKYRFGKPVCDRLNQLKWWDLDIDELSKIKELWNKPLTEKLLDQVEVLLSEG